MPIKSKDQWGKLFAMAERGEISERKAKEMARETKTPYKKLPEDLPEKNSAVRLGCMLALEDLGLVHTKEAGAEPSALSGLLDMFRGTAHTPGAGRKLKDFLTAKKVRDALKDVSATRSELSKLEAAPTTAVRTSDAAQFARKLRVRQLLGQTKKDVLKELKPYGAVTGLAGLAALSPSILKATYPELEE